MTQYIEITWTGSLKGKEALKILQKYYRFRYWGDDYHEENFVCLKVKGRIRKSDFQEICELFKKGGALTMHVTLTWEKSF